jgi:hypothetical protein
MSGADFATASAVTPLGDGGYEVDLLQQYAIAGTKPNGGYLIACMARAALAGAADAGSVHVHPISAGAQYLASPDVGLARIDTEVLRVGRSATQVSARLSQDGRVAVDAKFILATLPSGSEPYWGGLAPVEIPPLDQCEVPASDSGPAAWRSGTRVVFDPATSFTMTPDGPIVGGDERGELRAWFVNDDTDVVDPVMLLFAADSMPPATFSILTTGWVPTLDITIYIRAIPVPGPLRVRFRTQMIQDGFADEICEAWDSSGRLVLQSTQIVAIRMPTVP